jgi:hypothetical protein
MRSGCLPRGAEGCPGGRSWKVLLRSGIVNEWAGSRLVAVKASCAVSVYGGARPCRFCRLGLSGQGTRSRSRSLLSNHCGAAARGPAATGAGAGFRSGCDASRLRSSRSPSVRSRQPPPRLRLTCERESRANSPSIDTGRIVRLVDAVDLLHHRLAPSRSAQPARGLTRRAVGGTCRAPCARRSARALRSRRAARRECACITRLRPLLGTRRMCADIAGFGPKRRCEVQNSAWRLKCQAICPATISA